MALSARRTLLPFGARLIMASVVILAGCARAVRSPFEEPAAPGTLEVSIKNQGLQDIRVILVSTLGSQRLGVVSGNAERTITIPWERSDRVSFRVEGLTEGEHTTEAVATSPGYHLELIVPMVLRQTVLRRR